MAEITQKKGFLGQLMQLPNDDPKKTIFWFQQLRFH